MKEDSRADEAAHRDGGKQARNGKSTGRGLETSGQAHPADARSHAETLGRHD
jgi:hypothetical protein